jgi:hypothetical protein
LRHRSASIVSSSIDGPTIGLATARMVGLICARRPMHICRGRVFCAA